MVRSISSNLLIVFTTHYPFYNSETFFENEISFLASRFKKILIIPNSVDKKNLEARPVPINVIVKPLKYSDRKATRFLLVLKGLLAIACHKEARKIYNTSKSENLLRRLHSIYYIGKAYGYFTNTKEILNKIGIKDSESVILYSYWLKEMATVAILLKKNYFSSSTTCLSRAHGGDLYEERAKFGYSPLKRYNMRNLDKIFPCSTDGTEYLKRLFPQVQEKISTQRLGTLKVVEEVNKTPCSSFLVVSCSNIKRVKRIDKIIDSLAILSSHSFNIRWIHFGDGQLRKEIEKYAQIKLLNKIDFEFKGNLVNRDILDFYAKNQIDLFINTSDSEGIPVSIMEAMSYGIPVIATNVGGVKELVNNKTGYLIDNDLGPSEISKVIEAFMGLTSCQKMDLGKAALALWECLFNAQTNYNNFIDKMME